MADWREVARVGLEELDGGASVPEVVALAAVTAETSGLDELVSAAAASVGDLVPDELEAARVVASDVADAIVVGTVTPLAGARELWRLGRRVPGAEPELRPFVALASEWEDDEANRPAYEGDIIIAARHLIADLGPESL